jgi:hypothetical protein
VNEIAREPSGKTKNCAGTIARESFLLFAGAIEPRLEFFRHI